MPSAEVIVVAEPLEKNVSSCVYVLLSVIPALFLPLLYWRRPGNFSRVIWCWVIPIAPVLFIWDGIISALRQWSDQEWGHALFTELGLDPEQIKVEKAFFTHVVTIHCQSVR
jgi:hypothetical protein